VKFKLDENRRGAAILAAAGHDVATVVGQKMTSAADSDLIAHCHSEDRCLVTMDLDFSNPLQFPPSKFSGIAVLQPAARPTLANLESLISTFAEALKQSTIDGRLWIVETGRIRQYSPDDE